MAKFGWCLTNQHNICIYVATGIVCDCECHNPAEEKEN